MAPSDWAIVWAGFGPGWFGGVGLAGLVGPFGWPELLGLAPFAGAIGGGLQRLGRVGWPPVDWGGVGPRAIGRGGAIGPG